MKRSTQLRAAGSLKEAHIQRAVVDFMLLDGWRAIRTELTVQRERGRVVGEAGMPDYLFVRYIVGPSPRVAELIWIEFKRCGEKPKVHQLRWHEEERKRGALVVVVDDIDAYIRFYKSSGYARRVA